MVEIFSNDIPEAELRDKISQAVRAAIGERAGDWEAEIHSSSWVITITGPDSFEWEHEFFGPDEHSPEVIQETIEEGLPG